MPEPMPNGILGAYKLLLFEFEKVDIYNANRKQQKAY